MENVNIELDELDIISQEEKKQTKIYSYIKPAIGFLLSLSAILFLLPIFIIVAIAIKIQDGGNVIYSQTRIGKDGREFKIYKFRSMCMNADQKLAELQALNERDGPVFKITDDPRITKLGKILRKTCIDELPQLFNILKFDMAIVGPRPPLPSEVAVYSEHHKKRLSVTPGLTCYWQVNKTSKTTFAEWVDLDIKYIKEQSFITDLKIIFKTIKVVVSGKGDN